MNSKHLSFNKEAIDQEFARRNHIDYMRYMWSKKEPFVIGRHTKEICYKIDNAIAKYRKGRSVYLIITVPVRHGKSAIVSRYLPSRLLGLFPDCEIILCSYSTSLTYPFSRINRDKINSDKYRQLFPNVRIKYDNRAVESWGLEQSAGVASWSGIGGGITGKGYNFGIVDDYLRSRQDAESQTIRDKQWDWFTNVFFTRAMDPSITVILATPWHTDDIIGRIKDKNNPSKKTYDKKFPAFEVVNFPAFSDKYESGFLFPDRFSKHWYESRKAALGNYGTQSLLQCNPVPRMGNLLKINHVKIVDSFPEGLIFVRVWDLASTKKEKLKQDPDYTAGGLIAIKDVGGVYHLYIKHFTRGQWETTVRDKNIINQSGIDGEGVRIGVECVAGYKDTYENIKSLLFGIRMVEPILPQKDKIIRASLLEPIFDAGNVYLMRGEWNQSLLDEIAAFPSGKHDDQVDVLTNAYSMIIKNTGIVDDSFELNDDTLYTEERESII